MTRSRFVAVRFLMLAGLIACFPSLAAAQYEYTQFFVVAHPDDWQLFMQPNAYNEAQKPRTKVVFIYLSAGDAGCGPGCIQGDGVTPYYLARENGAMRAARFVGTRGNTWASRGTTSIVTVAYPIRRVVRHEYNNTVSYFLRLPDGGSGDGYSTTGMQSLKRLHEGAAIWDVNFMALYPSWADLVSTLEWILIREATGNGKVTVSLQEPDTTLSPGDHTDHVYAGRAMTDAISGYTCLTRQKFLGYVTRGMPMNLTAIESRQEAATWGATVSALIDAGSVNTYDDGHNSSLGKRYVSTVFGYGACSF